MITPVPNTDLALTFLAILDPNGRHDLFAIGANGQTEAATFFLPQDGDKARNWIDAQQGKRNVYAAINRGRENEFIDHRLSKQNIGVIRALAVDLDPKKLDANGAGDLSGDHFRNERARLLHVVKKACEDSLYPPSLVLDSGGGYWLLWIFDPPIQATLDSVATAEGINRTLAARFGGDSVQDVSRVMRLPGTINIPDAGKAKQGRTPALATIPIEFISDKHYTLDELAAWAPPTPEKATVKDRPTSPIDMDAVNTDTYAELPEGLRNKFEAYCTSRPAVGALWHG